MEPKKFKEANVVMGEGQPEYKPLPAYKDGGAQGHVVTQWKLSFWERVRILFGANVWLSQMTFHSPLQPVFLSTKKYDILIKQKKK